MTNQESAYIDQWLSIEQIFLLNFNFQICGLRYCMSQFDQSGVTVGGMGRWWVGWVVVEILIVRQAKKLEDLAVQKLLFNVLVS